MLIRSRSPSSLPGYHSPMRGPAFAAIVVVMAAACGGGSGTQPGVAEPTSIARPATTSIAAGGEAEPSHGGSLAGGETVWEVIERSREDDLEVNDPVLLAAFDSQIAGIQDVWELADAVDDVETVFADDYIDVVVRDSLLARLAEIESRLRDTSDDMETDEGVSQEIGDENTAIDERGSEEATKPESPAGADTSSEEREPAIAAVPASLDSGIVAYGNLGLGWAERMNDRSAVPVASLIQVSAPDGSGMVTVTGSSGSVPYGDPERPWSFVDVIAVEWGTQDCVERRSDGSFSARLEAAAGSTLYVLPIQPGTCTGQGIQTGPAAVLEVPGPGAATTLGRAGDSLKWSAVGSLAGSDRQIQFTVHDDAGDQCLVPRIHLYRLFDGQGAYLTQVNVNVHGPVLTPTGLPIESSDGSNGYYETVEFVDAPGCLQSSLTLTPAALPASLAPGWYLPRIVFGEVNPGGIPEFGSGTNFPGGDGLDFEGNTGFGYLPLVGVGTTSLPRLPATLMNEAPSWGAAGVRGVVADEDAGRFALGSRRSINGPFIASPTDPLSGQSIHYTLEPYLPTVGYTGFAASMPEPLFRLDAAQPGSITVSLTTPDGSTTMLADDAEVRMFVSSAWFAGYPVELPFSGPSRTVGLTTGVDALDLAFDQFGLHTVAIEGTLRSSRGDEFVLRGTYDIWVAEPLDLSLGVFEGTPLEVGDAWNPTVVVEPGVPAGVTIAIAHYPNGDVALRRDHTVSGTANRFGYFASDQQWRPAEHGEYRVDVTASYLDPVDGTLWMGARSAASIVATPDSPLVAHGERNAQLARAAGDNIIRTWFFNRTVDPTCGEEGCDPMVGTKGLDYPFFSGDVAWLVDMSPIMPRITVNGPAAALTAVAPQLQPKAYCLPGMDGCVDAPDTHFLFSDRAAGNGSHQRADDVESWAYWYSTSVRADVSVFSAVGEGQGGEHNHWYGHDTYSCQIGLTCRDSYFGPPQGGRGGSDSRGDEEGDVKLLFGGAVLKNGSQQHFLPYASMAVIVEEGSRSESGVWSFGDAKGNRICPPYQGAAGGIGTCGPLFTHRGREVDLFITPTGTRPGSVLQPGDLFTFSGQAWPTLAVAVDVTVTGPVGQARSFQNRANPSGFVDVDGMAFVVEQPGVYEVHVSAAQDRALPSTGLAPVPAIVADGRTTMDAYGYSDPLSAVLGTTDSTYRFYVVEEQATSPIRSATSILHGPPGPNSVFGWAGNRVEKISFVFPLPAGVDEAHYSLTAPGLVIEEGTVSGSSTVTVEVVQDDLYEAGFTQIILGADTLQLSIAYETPDGWEAQILNQRGFSPLGGVSVQ